MPERILSAYRGIRFRLIVPAILIIVVVVSLFAYLSARHQQSELIGLTKRHATQLSEAVVRSMRPSMMVYDVEGMREIFRNVGRQEGVLDVRLYDKIIRPPTPASTKEGQIKIRYSSDPAEVGRPVDIGQQQCMVCHAHEKPLVEHEGGEHRIFHHPETGLRVLGVISPIYNERSCYTAACHVHDETQRVLGVLDVIVSLEEVDRQIAANTWTVVEFTVPMVVILAVFIGLFLRHFVARPVAQLTSAVERVSEGDLSAGIRVRSNDEFGDLAEAFNRMMRDLARAQAENEAWGRTLEARVEERTAELRRAQEQILQSEKLASLGKLAASVAHEINNPLTGILTFVRMFQEWVRDGTFPPEKTQDFQEFLKIMSDETLRSTKIVRNLLAFARRSKIDVKPAHINEVIEQSLTLVAHQLALQEVEIERDLAPDLPPFPMDRGQIQQTLVNILLNASEAMPEGGAVSVSSRLTEGGEGVEIVIADEGVGIPPEDLPQLFDPFFTTKEEGKGTGLGLSVAYGIIEKHGGRIEVDSEVGTGTRFRIVLPRWGRDGEEGVGGEENASFPEGDEDDRKPA